MPWIAHPHIGEYVAKTNAIRDGGPIPATPDCSPGGRACCGERRELCLAYCPWFFSTLIAGRGQFGTVLLKAGENGEVALIDDRAAVALNVADAGFLLLRRAAALLLGDRAG